MSETSFFDALANALLNGIQTIANVQSEIGDICDVFPPGINSFTSVLVNLPLILLWLITLPPRFFFCVLSSITQIPIYGLIMNVFPPLAVFCPFTQSSEVVCFSNCPGCSISGTCVTIPSSISNFCTKALPYFSILDQMFCLLGYIVWVIAYPSIELLNIIFAPTGRQICLIPDANVCFGGGNNESV